ncbi:MAG: hypothetical protein J6T15_02305 [Bacilli bacterium]|nr:hypothetical protein [Bacilli bacterium]
MIKNKEYDQNIINALKMLPIPLKTFNNHIIKFDLDKRYETIFEHIASDIQIIPLILKNKSSLKSDKNSKKYRNYIGKRVKKNERFKYIKIVTIKNKHQTESIITIMLVKKIVDS